MLILDNLFYEISAIIAVAAVIGALGTFLRQPIIVSFIVAGIIVGPAGFGWVTSADQLDLLAKIGITLLLFVVGLKLDVHLIRTLGPVALNTGLGQVLFTSLIGYFIALGLGLPPIAALYVAVALTFSSTIIIVKLLTDKREIDALHGRIAVGFLIVQDLVVILVMITLTAIGAGDSTQGLEISAIGILIKGILFLTTIVLLMRYVLPKFTEFLAHSRELLLLFAIAWGVSLASISEVLGFSKEVGAFVAGVALASTHYRDTIGSRLTSLRDFLLLFFFVNLGAQLKFSILGTQIWPAIILSLFVLIGNPVVVMIIMGIMGYRKRTGFLAGLTVAQISEFSLLFGALGVTLGHISRDILSLITLVGIITIGLSTYMILYSHTLYGWIGNWLTIFEKYIPHREEYSAGSSGEKIESPEIVIFGLGKFGGKLAEELHKNKQRVLGVDFNPAVVKRYQQQGITAHYADAEDPEIFNYLQLHGTKWVISTIPYLDTIKIFHRALIDNGYSGKFAMTAYSEENAKALEELSPDLILNPFQDTAQLFALELTASQ